MKIWPKNFLRYNELLSKRDTLLAVGLTQHGNLAIELGAANAKLRVGALIYRDRDAIVHTCHSTKDGKPCWHLAAAVDVYNMVYNKPLAIVDGSPVIDINVLQKTLRNVDVGIDLTPEYLQYKGLPAKVGDFAIFNYKPITSEREDPTVVAINMQPLEEPKALARISNWLSRMLAG